MLGPQKYYAPHMHVSTRAKTVHFLTCSPFTFNPIETLAITKEPPRAGGRTNPFLITDYETNQQWPERIGTIGHKNEMGLTQLVSRWQLNTKQDLFSCLSNRNDESTTESAR